MALNSNRNIWYILTGISIFLAGFFAVLFYFEDIFVILVVGAILITINEKATRFFGKILEKYPAWNNKKFKTILVIVVLTGTGALVYSQLHEIGTLLTNTYQLQQDYKTGSTALVQEQGSHFSKLTETGLLKGKDLDKLGNFIFSGIKSSLSKFSYYVFTGILIIPLMFSLHRKHKGRMKDYVHTYLAPKYAEGAIKVLENVSREFENFLTAKLIQVLAVCFICCTGFYLVGIQGWFFLGLMVGLLNIIPYIGFVLGAILPLIVGYMTSPATAVLALAVVGIAQAVDNFYLTPFMISEKVNISPLLSVILTLAAEKLLGALGMVLAIPIYIFCKVILKEVYLELEKIYPDTELEKSKGCKYSVSDPLQSEMLPINSEIQPCKT